MKRCPTCNRTFTDSHLSFCLDDGTPLVAVAEPADEITVVSPSTGQTQNNPPPTESYPPGDWTSPDYLPPGSPRPSENIAKRRVWPWVAGIFGVLLIAFVGLGIAAFIYLPRILSERTSNSNRNVEPANSNANSNANANTNSNVNANVGQVNTNSAANASNANVAPEDENLNANPDGSGAPTDHADVLTTLSDLEHDWTVANINADKKALGRILADDYVSTVNGRTVGKVEYINTIQRDTTTQDWKFEDLKLDLKGTRATLSGLVTFSTADQEAKFRFVDKFVWRDGRWQATGSEITRVS